MNVQFDPQAAHAFLTNTFTGLPGLVQICSNTDNIGKFFPTNALTDAVAYAQQCDRAGAHSIYFRTTTVSRLPDPGKRGGADLTAAMTFLWGDVDYGTVGHAPRVGNELPLPPDMDAARLLMHESGLPHPSTLIHSGGGFYPLWYLDTPAIGTAESGLSTAVQTALVKAAEQRRWHYGNVGDLARILRLPGSVNRKEPNNPRPCLIVPGGGSGARITRNQLPPPPAPPKSLRAPYNPDGPKHPFDVFAETMTWADILTPFDWTHIGNSSDGKQEYEEWLRPYDPLYGAPSSDCSAHAFPGYLVVWSDNAGLPHGPGQNLTKARVWGHLHGITDDSAVFRELQRAAFREGAGPADELPPDVLDALHAYMTAEHQADTPAPLDLTPTTLEAAPMNPLLPDPKGDLTGWSPIFASRLTHEFLSQPPPPPKPWILKDLLRVGDLGTLVAGAKVGKSLLTFERALEAAKEGYVVVYFDAENGHHDINKRINEYGYAGALPPTFHYFSFPVVTLDTPAGAAEFMNWAQQFFQLTKRIDVIILDTVSRFLDGDENDQGPWLQMYRRVFQPLKRNGIAVLRLDHTGKDESKGARGASAKTGDVDVAIQMSVLSLKGEDYRTFDAHGPQTGGVDLRTAELELQTTHQRSGTYPDSTRLLRSTVSRVLGHRPTTAAQAGLAALAADDDQEALAIFRMLQRRDPEGKWGYRKAENELAYKFDAKVPEAKWRKAVNLHKRALDSPEEDPLAEMQMEQSTTPDGLEKCGTAVGSNEDPLPRGAPHPPQSTAPSGEENKPQVRAFVTAVPQPTAPLSTVPGTAPSPPYKGGGAPHPASPQSSDTPRAEEQGPLPAPPDPPTPMPLSTAMRVPYDVARAKRCRSPFDCGGTTKTAGAHLVLEDPGGGALRQAEWCGPCLDQYDKQQEATS